MPASIAKARTAQTAMRWPVPPDGLVIGLVNNMPDAAIKATERQFLGLLDAAAGGRTVLVQLYGLPGVPRSASARADLMPAYSSTETLVPGDVDALIITGAEPRAAAIEDEPYWPAFAALTDWAKSHTFSCIFSCLAAHAAVLHLDGIGRRRLPAKLSGLYDCASQSDHALVAGAPTHYRVPHSRLNELVLGDLEAKGYQVLVRSDRAGADTFVRDRECLFVFLQGHMEYDAQSLLHEYHRDITRFINGERENYPEMPANYLDAAAAVAFAAVRERARAGAAADGLLTAAAAAVAGARVANTWRRPATSIYANWISQVASRKAARPGERGSPNQRSAHR